MLAPPLVVFGWSAVLDVRQLLVTEGGDGRVGPGSIRRKPFQTAVPEIHKKNPLLKMYFDFNNSSCSLCLKTRHKFAIQNPVAISKKKYVSEILTLQFYVKRHYQSTLKLSRQTANE